MDVLGSFLAPELWFLVIDHLVDDKITLGNACLINFNWKYIVQGSDVWLLWRGSLLPKAGKIPSYFFKKTNPLVGLQDTTLSEIFRFLMFKKYVHALDECFPQTHCQWFFVMIASDNEAGIKLLERVFHIAENKPWIKAMQTSISLCKSLHGDRLIVPSDHEVMAIFRHNQAIFYMPALERIQRFDGSSFVIKEVWVQTVIELLYKPTNWMKKEHKTYELVCRLVN